MSKNIWILDVKPDDCVNYKKISLFVGIGRCNWKCCIEAGIPHTVCQNSPLAKATPKKFDANAFIEKYADDMTEACVVGGLEPLMDMESLLSLASAWAELRPGLDFVVYTGHNEDEVEQKIRAIKDSLKCACRLIVKYGRYRPNETPKFDEVLGVELASPNQHGVIYEY